ncbi:hypothetical protein BC829DRAFT_356744, partial [Chytridium lagenaria]
CRLYTEYGAVRCFIETAKCTRCPRRYNRFIGPDLSAKGIYNKNNFYLITHFCLDKITELITTTTFSFHAYSNHLKSNYNEFGRGRSILSGFSNFFKAWFSYRKLQDLTKGMDIQCPFCKKHGYDLVACDGISIGYQEDKKTNNLMPPTFIDLHSTPNDSVK